MWLPLKGDWPSSSSAYWNHQRFQMFTGVSKKMVVPSQLLLPVACVVKWAANGHVNAMASNPNSIPSARIRARLPLPVALQAPAVWSGSSLRL